MKCSYCGKDIDDQKSHNITFQSSVNKNIAICQECVMKMASQVQDDEGDFDIDDILGLSLGDEDDEKPKKKKSSKIQKSDIKPKEIKAYLDESVINQDNAKKILSVAITNHTKLLEYNAFKKKDVGIDVEKSNLIMIGSSGCGKTFLIKQLAKYLGRPCVIVDASSLTKSGFVGEDVNSILAKLYREAGNDVERTQQGIVYIDEIDKIAARDPKNAGSQGSDIGGRDVQYELLKLVEGGKVAIKSNDQQGGFAMSSPTVEIDTTNILFICGGAFTGIEKKIAARLNKDLDTGLGFSSEASKDVLEEKSKYNDVIDYILPEDLDNFGIIPELLGRLPVICPLKELSVEDLKQILTTPKHAIFKQIKELIGMYDIEINFDDDTIDTIAKLAYDRKTGARALKSVVQGLVDDKLFDIDENTKEIRITSEDVNNKYSYYLNKEAN